MKLKRPQGAQWSVKALAESDELQIVMYDDIGESWFGEGVTSRAVIEALNSAPDAKTIRVALNSPGGDVFEGVAIHTALAKHPAKVIVEVDALAASAASVIAMAGDEVHMAAGAMMMIHGAWTLTQGNAETHAARAEMLTQVGESLLDIYEGKASLSRDELAQMMADETWFTAKQAKAAGLATHLSSRKVEPKARALANDFLAQMQSPKARELAVSAAATDPPPLSTEGPPEEDGNMTTKLLLKLGVEDEAQGLAAIDASTGFINAVKAATGAADFSAALDRVGSLSVLAQVEGLAEAKGDELLGKIAAFRDAAEKLPELEAQIAEAAAKAEADKLVALVDGALEKGKVTKARADWLKAQPLATAESFLAVSGDSLPGANGVKPAEQPSDAIHLTDDDRKIAAGFGMTEEEFIAAKREADGLPPVVSDDEGEA